MIVRLPASAALLAIVLLPAGAGTLAAQERGRTAAPDTVRRAPMVISEWHARRLTIHRMTAYTIPPLFAAQGFLGQRLYAGVQSAEGPAGWVRPAHRTGAALIGTAFAINATTGVWNLWAARHEPEDRVIRVVHGASMLAAAGGFTYAGVRLSEQAQSSLDKRREHRRVALGSMGLTLLSGTMMWWVNR